MINHFIDAVFEAEYEVLDLLDAYFEALAKDLDTDEPWAALVDAHHEMTERRQLCYDAETEWLNSEPKDEADAAAQAEARANREEQLSRDRGLN